MHRLSSARSRFYCAYKTAKGARYLVYVDYFLENVLGVENYKIIKLVANCKCRAVWNKCSNSNRTMPVRVYPLTLYYLASIYTLKCDGYETVEALLMNL